MKTELTREESQHLIDLGVPKEKATEVVFNPNNNDYDFVFSLTDFLNGEILPKEIELNGRAGNLVIELYDDFVFVKYDFYFNKFAEEELIDALYKLACWYYEYLKVKRNDTEIQKETSNY